MSEDERRTAMIERRSHKRFKVVITALVLLYLMALALDLYPGLRGGSGWDWAYGLPDQAAPVILLAVLLLVYAVGALRLRGRVRPALVWAVIGGTVLAFAVVNVSPRGDAFFHLFTRTVSPVQTGASTVAVRYLAEDGLYESLGRWTAIMRESRERNLIHFTTSPPGQPLIHHMLAGPLDIPIIDFATGAPSMALRALQCSDPQVMDYTRGEILSAGLVAYLMPLLAALTAVPLYLIVRDLDGESRTALQVAQWWPLIPAPLMFAPVWNTLYPLLISVAFYLLLRALQRRCLRYAFLSGLVMSVTTFLNFAVLPALLLFGLFTLGYWAIVTRQGGRPPSFWWTVINGVWFAVGLVTVWVLYDFTSGLNALDLWRVTLESHRDLVQRSYAAWLILHPYDVLMFTGWAASGLALWGLVIAVRRVIQRRGEALDVFTVAMALTVLAVNFAGIVQGENARILMYYMPLLLVMAARTLTLYPQDAPLFAAQAVTVLVMATVLRVVPLDLNPIPEGPRTDIAALDGVPWTESGARFASVEYPGEFALARYRWVGDPSRQAVTFEFEWEGRAPTERPYTFALVAAADDPEVGRVESEPLAWQPQNASYLTTCWRSGDVIRDTVVLDVPPVSAPVTWTVTLTAVDARTGDRAILPLTLAPIPYP
jgi:hypothetical protein